MRPFVVTVTDMRDGAMGPMTAPRAGCIASTVDSAIERDGGSRSGCGTSARRLAVGSCAAHASVQIPLYQRIVSRRSPTFFDRSSHRWIALSAALVGHPRLSGVGATIVP